MRSAAGNNRAIRNKGGSISIRNSSALALANEIIWNLLARSWKERKVKYADLSEAKEPTSISKPLPESPVSFDTPSL